MNSTPEILKTATPGPYPANGSAACSVPGTPPPDAPERRARGKIGRLPKAARDHLNEMIQDGVPYAEIPARLGDLARDVTPRDISRWQRGPHYQRWVLDQDWLEKLRDDQEPALALLDGIDNIRFEQAALQLAVTRLFLALRHADNGNLNQHLGGNAPAFARLVHALARACNEFSRLQKSAAAATLAQTPNLIPKDPDRNISDQELNLVVDKWDQVFKRAKSRTPGANDPGPSAPNAQTAPGKDATNPA